MDRLTTYRGKTLLWSKYGTLANYNGNTYTYDANGVRLSKTVNGVITKFYTNGNTQILKSIDGTNEIWYNYGVNGIQGITVNNTEYLFRKNVQGDVTHIYKLNTDGSLVLSAEYKYDAWGKCEVVETDNSGIGAINPIRYRGYYYDVETGLYYLNSRYYDPETGRFISADSTSYLDPESINGLNLYAYCASNPVMAVDPNGNSWWDWLIATVVVAVCVVGAVLTGGTSLVAGSAFAGAAIGGTISLVSQGICCLTSGTDFSWGKFALDLGVGALSGAIGASGISQLGSMACGALIGGSSDFASQLISGRSLNDINISSVLLSACIGGVAGYISGAGAKNISRVKANVIKDSAVQKAQMSVSKVSSKLANGLYKTTQGAKSAYTQVMNGLNKAIRNAKHIYVVRSLLKTMLVNATSTSLTSGMSFVSVW